MREGRTILGGVLPMLFLAVTIVLLSGLTAYAQPKPPRPIKVTVNNAQGIQFGAFVASSSPGVVTISPSGIRSSSGGITRVNLGYTFSAAVYNITTVPGTLISVAFTQSTLTGPIPSTPLTLNMGPTEKGSTFVATQSSFSLNIGGTLSVPANPTVGSYSGMYTVTFIQQ